MKIIDNKKDYYDYLASIYGIDELVIYDRRGSVTLNSDKVLLQSTLIDVIKDVQQRYSDVPMCIIPCHAEYWRWHHEEKWEEIKSSLTHHVENPILAGTFIPKRWTSTLKFSLTTAWDMAWMKT